MEKHKLNFYPEMQKEDFDNLKNNIELNGFDVKFPIILFENEILDGWNRQKVCNELNIIPTYTYFSGSTEEALNFVIRSNQRRNLTSEQRACIAVEATSIIEILKTEAKEKMLKGKTDPVQKIAQGSKEENKTNTKLANQFNTNKEYIRKALNLKNDNPELFNSLKNGETTLKEIKIQNREKEIENLRTKIQNTNFCLTGDTKYDVIAIDPPWPYGGEYDPENRRVTSPYPEMAIEEIQAINLPIKTDAVVFLWTTHRFLPDAFKIAETWGLEYKGIITWDKVKMGIGTFIRIQCEFCLILTKGKPLTTGSNVRDIITEARRQHSRKPEGFYELVEKFTVGKKLDYFSREKRNGWDCLGIEVNKFNDELE